MKLSRFAALLLSATLTLSLALPVRAAEGENWLVPPTQKAVAFTDTAGTICEQAAICCRTGLMAGVDARHFYPESGLTHAQITVIAARLHKLLSGSTASFTAASGEQWWSPCDVYLRREIPALISNKTYAAMTESPTASAPGASSSRCLPWCSPIPPLSCRCSTPSPPCRTARMKPF